MVVAIHGLEVIISGSCTVGLFIAPVLTAVVYKASPDNDGTIFFSDISEHICTVSLSPAISERSGTSFGVSLYQETFKCRYLCKYLCHLFLPPGLYTFVQRICTVHTADLYSRSIVKTQIQADTIACKYFSKLSQLFKISVGYHV